MKEQLDIRIRNVLEGLSGKTLDLFRPIFRFYLNFYKAVEEIKCKLRVRELVEKFQEEILNPIFLIEKKFFCFILSFKVFELILNVLHQVLLEFYHVFNKNKSVGVTHLVENSTCSS